MDISSLDLTKRFEGLKLTAYRDGGGIWTIGYGHTGNDVFEGQAITEAQAELLLRQDMAEAVKCVNAATATLNPTQSQFDSLCDFAYDAGCGSLHKLLSHGWDQVTVQIPRWVHDAAGRVEPGLVTRRKAEVEVFESCCATLLS